MGEGVAELAIELAIRALSAELVVQGPLALDAGEALAMVQSGLGRHLLGFKNLAATPGAALPLLFGRDDGGVGGHLRPLIGRHNLEADLHKKHKVRMIFASVL